MQYTIRQIPAAVDKALRRKAKTEGKSLNEAAIDALRHGTGLTGEPPTFHDLDSLAGTWVEDPKFDQAIADQDRIDPELWK